MEQNTLVELKKTIIVQASTLGVNTEFYEDLDLVDPKDETKTIIEIMEKCISQEIDPWKVDVVNFVMIVSALTAENLMSIGEAGYIILRSWGIVNIQARDLMDIFNGSNEENPDFQGDFDDQEMDHDDFNGEFVSLKMPVKHHETRKVMLVELIEVMRKTERVRSRIRVTKSIEDALEVEDIYEVLNGGEPEREIEELLSRLIHLLENGVFMEEIWGSDTDERVKTFIHCLFLRSRGDITLQQEVPYGRIWIAKEE